VWYVLQLFSEEKANVVVVWMGAHEHVHVVCRISVVSAIDELEWCTTKLLSTNIHTLYQVQLNANKLKIIKNGFIESLYF
jgi:hypothetical protein